MDQKLIELQQQVRNNSDDLQVLFILYDTAARKPRILLIVILVGISDFV